MSDTTSLDNNEITDLLFKSYLGFPSTSESNAFYDEPNAIKYNNYVIGSDVMVDTIPTGENLSWSAITLAELDSEFDISLSATDFSNAVGADDVEIDVSRAVVRFNHLRIDNINSQPTDAFYKLDGNGNNVLKDSIQYNYNKYTDGDGAIQQPYIYSLYDSDKSKLVPSNGNWLFDVKFGVVTFYDFTNGIPSSKNVDKDAGIYLTFCKYVGRKGVSNISSTADLTGGQDASFGEVEVSGNLTVDRTIVSKYLGVGNTTYYSEFINSTSSTSKTLRITINRVSNYRYNGMFNMRISIDKSFQPGYGMGTTTIDLQGYLDETSGAGFSAFNYTPIEYADGIGMSFITYHMTTLSDQDGPLDDNNAYVYIKFSNLNYYYSTLRVQHTTVNEGSSSANHQQSPFDEFISFDVISDASYNSIVSSYPVSSVSLKTRDIIGNLNGDVTGNLIGDVTGNADTVTNGVYTTGNQTIAGTKTFSNTIIGSITGNAVTVTNGVYKTGDQTIAGTKTFSSTIVGDITGNAGTVTNGVYTSGDQTIAGTKTFSNTIVGNVTGNLTGDITGNAETVTNGVYTTGNQTIGGTKTFSNSIIGNLTGNLTGNVSGNVTGNVSGTVTDTNPVIIPTTNSTNIYLKQNGNYASFYASSGTNIRDLLMSFYAVDDNTTSTANTDTTQIAGYLYRKWKFFNLSGEGSNSIIYANTVRGATVEGTNIEGNSMFAEQYLINTNGYDWKIENNTGGSATYDNDLHFLYGSGIKGSIRSSASNSWANYMNFTGQHHNYSPNEDISVIYKGFIVSSSGTYKNFFESGNTKSKNNITINDSLPIVVLSSKQQDKACFGVISDKDDESDTIKQSSGNFVSVFQVKNEDRRLAINSLGEGAMWVCDANGAIENGDYITTSVIPGIGMKQDEVFLANYTVAKITMDCDFAPQMVHQNKLKLDASGNPIFNETTRQYEYELKYDESGNPVMEEEYDQKYLVVNGDGYVVYNDEARTDVFLQHEHDFATLQPDIIGNTYKMAFVGCTYHCG